MFTKRLFCGLFSLILGTILCSCGQNNGADSAIEVKDIEDPSVDMKEVTQDSYDGTITFRLQIPEDWSIHMGDDGQILIYPETASEESDCLRLAPKDFSGVVTELKDESIYQSLFSGDVAPYEDSIKTTFAQQMDWKTNWKTPAVSFGLFGTPRAGYQYSRITKRICPTCSLPIHNIPAKAIRL